MVGTVKKITFFLPVHIEWKWWTRWRLVALLGEEPQKRGGMYSWMTAPLSVAVQAIHVFCWFVAHDWDKKQISLGSVNWLNLIFDICWADCIVCLHARLLATRNNRYWCSKRLIIAPRQASIKAAYHHRASRYWNVATKRQGFLQALNKVKQVF